MRDLSKTKDQLDVRIYYICTNENLLRQEKMKKISIDVNNPYNILQFVDTPRLLQFF